MRLTTTTILLLLLFLTPGCAGSRPPRSASEGFIQVGYASYYSNREQGRRTASGKAFNDRRLTAAHPTLPFGTRVRVTNLTNVRSVIVTITDRGPFRRNRVIDVTKRAAQELGFLRAGTTRVRLEVVSLPSSPDSERSEQE